jgi:hypothetical protein
MPYFSLDRRITTMRIHYDDFPYHLVLLQLEHDSSFQKHSLFTRMEEFLTVVLTVLPKARRAIIIWGSRRTPWTATAARPNASSNA